MSKIDCKTPNPEVLDARGLECPEPLRQVKQWIDVHADFRELLIQATDPAAPIDFEAWCYDQPFEYQGCVVKEDWIEIRITREQ